MPRGNGTGPMGMGPMTGRAAGYCAGQGVPGYMNPYGGRGLGMAWGRGGRGMGMAWGRGGRGMGMARGRGGGRGMGMARGRGWERAGGGDGWDFAPVPFRGPYAEPEPTAEQQLPALREQADWLKQQLDAVGARVRELQDAQD